MRPEAGVPSLGFAIKVFKLLNDPLKRMLLKLLGRHNILEKLSQWLRFPPRAGRPVT